MKSLPILLNNPKILLIGGGTVALQKATVLLSNEIDFRIISKEYLPEFNFLHVKKNTKEFEIEDTKGFGYVVDATGNKEVQAIQRAVGHIDKTKAKIACKKQFSQLYLIGCGLGDTELLTIKAYKAMQVVDIALYDHLITDEILELLPPHVKRVFVGKKKGAHSKSQEEINELILSYVKQGFKVARLKSGDPYIFGRGAEEAKEIIENGYRVEVINGLSSSIAGVAEAGIPVTARGYATNFSVVSAHLKGSLINLDWIEFLNIKNHTTVVLMGLSLCKNIQIEAIKIGISKDIEVAIISNASRVNQKVKVTTLETLHVDSLDMVSPAVLVFGRVVGLASILG